MKKTLIWSLVFLSIIILMIRFSSKIAESLFGIKQTGGISVLSQPIGATVTLDGKQVGQTPYEDKSLDVKSYLVKIDKADATWQGMVNLTAHTMTIVNRDLSKDQTSSAGEILTLDKGRGITVISNPSDADVEIDGKSDGKTPITANVLTGEHTILVSHTNFLKRSIRANLPDNYNLTVSADLSLSEADLTTISTPVISQTPQVLVKQTPTGFLRVRDKPNLAGKEIGRVAPGDTLILLEELGSWDRVRLSEGSEGYVSSSYVEKKDSQAPK